MRRSRHVWITSLAIALSCGSPARPPIAPTGPTPTGPTVAGALQVGREHVKIEPAADGKVAITVAEPVPAKPPAIATLSDAETQALLARLEPLPVITGPAPAIRAPSAAPPRTGAATPIALVPMGGKAIADSAPGAPPPKPVAPPKPPDPVSPPQILPTDQVRAASEVHVRFDEPMVAVAAVDAVGPSTPPATITPAVPGSWRWIDTRVAKFTATSRFPSATKFTITVPAGIKSIAGGTLAAAATGTFSTPPIRVASVFPRWEIRPDSPIVLELDQPFDPDAIVKQLRVERRTRVTYDDNGEAKPQPARAPKLPFDVITVEQAKTLWARDPRFRPDEFKLPDHYIVLAPKPAWPADTEEHVILGKGAPSREGPLASQEETQVTFEVVAPFVFLGLSCDSSADGAVTTKPRFSGATCPINRGINVELTGSVDEKRWKPELIRIEGKPIDKDFKPYSAYVWLETPRIKDKQFTVVVEGELFDQAGQQLQNPRRATFTTSRAVLTPTFSMPSGVSILDPRYKIPQWTFTAAAMTSVHVELYKVEPSDFFAYQAWEHGKRSLPPGKKIVDKTYPVGDRQEITARVDLRPLLPAGVGHVIAVATPSAKSAGMGKNSQWIQVSKLGVSARFDAERVHAWVHQIGADHFLEPIAATTTLVVDGRTDTSTATTDAAGHASFELLDRKAGVRSGATALVIAQAGTDSVFAGINSYEKSVRIENARWYVTDDRFTYKPGEPVYIKGWVRWTHDGVNPDIAVPAAGDTVKYELVDSKNAKLGSGTATLTPQGGFDAEVAIPANANLGTAYFRFETRGATYNLGISIEEFRTPTYAVTMNDDVAFGGTAPLIVGEAIEMAATAKYYAGGGLAGARVKWAATLRSASYTPPGWDDYSFAPLSSERRWSSSYRRTQIRASHSEYSTLTGSSSSTAVIGLPALPDNEPAVLVVDATVTDIDRASMRETSRAIVVHPSAYYVGIRQKPDIGDRDELELVVTDVDGTVVPNVAIDVEVEGGNGAAELEGEVLKNPPPPVVQHCKLTSKATPVTCVWKRKDRDTAYRATAKIVDSRGRANGTRYFIPWYPTSSQEIDLGITSDKAQYRPGDVAKLTIQSAVVPAIAVVTFARQGVIAQKRVPLKDKATIVELPIEASFMRNVHVVVDRYGQRFKRKDLPDVASTALELKLDPDFGHLQMVAHATKKAVEPGERATFEVTVKHRGKPVPGAEVALIVVDEAVLALSDRVHGDPLVPFYFEVEAGTRSMSSLGMVGDATGHLDDQPGVDRIDLDDPAHMGYGVGGGRGGMRGRTSSVPSVRIGQANVTPTRKDFRATAVFSPKLVTDSDGRATVSIQMPDSLTRFRIIGLATANTRYFGKAESTILTQRSLNARIVAPRFLQQGDALSLPVVVQNLGGVAKTIDVAVRTANLEQIGPAGKRITVQPGQRAELRFDLRTKTRGKAVIQAIAATGSYSDASQIAIPVYEPTTTEAFATYGTVDGDKPAFEQVAVPGDLVADVGGVETELSATQLSELTDAFMYLQAYPYECSEQRSSRMLANAAMADVLEAFTAPGRPTRADIEAQRTRDLAKLERDQNSDGGWGYFRELQSDPFVTQQVLAALIASKAKGKYVTYATAYVTKELTTRITNLEALAKRPLAQRTKQQLERVPYDVALAAAALTIDSLAPALARRADLALRLHAVATTLGDYPLDARARLLGVLAKRPDAAAVRKTLLAQLLSAVREDAKGATVTTKYVPAERLLLVSETKTTALVLDALIREAPDHTLIPKLQRGLLDSRKRGYWHTTQDNLAVLQTMRRYFDTYEKTAPSFAAKLWVGNAGYAEQTFDKRDTRAAVQVGWPQLVGPTHDLVLARSGVGRMYYRVGIRYAPKQQPTPLDAGFVVRRSYTAIDDPKDLVRLPDGHYKAKLGAQLLVTLEVLNTARRYDVALVDPLPAGFEPINTRLAHSERITVETDGWDHINQRDERAEAFSMDLVPGTHRFSYVVRATTPGTFIAAPAKAEEMYAPETFGRTGGAIVVVE